MPLNIRNYNLNDFDTLERLYYAPEVLTDKIHALKQNMVQNPAAINTNLMNLRKLETIQAFNLIDTLDVKLMQQIQDIIQQSPIRHGINNQLQLHLLDKFANDLDAINELAPNYHRLVDTQAVTNYLKQQVIHRYYFAMGLMRELKGYNISVAQIHETYLSEMRQQRQKSLAPTWIIGMFLRNIEIIKHLQQYLKRTLYRQMCDILDISEYEKYAMFLHQKIRS